MSKIHKLVDPVTEESYIYTTRDNKEQRLFDALKYALNDACPPEKEDYLCMMDESEEQRCEECWIRWATLPFGQRQNHK